MRSREARDIILIPHDNFTAIDKEAKLPDEELSTHAQLKSASFSIASL